MGKFVITDRAVLFHVHLYTFNIIHFRGPDKPFHHAIYVHTTKTIPPSSTQGKKIKGKKKKTRYYVQKLQRQCPAQPVKQWHSINNTRRGASERLSAGKVEEPRRPGGRAALDRLALGEHDRRAVLLDGEVSPGGDGTVRRRLLLARLELLLHWLLLLLLGRTCGCTTARAGVNCEIAVADRRGRVIVGGDGAGTVARRSGQGLVAQLEDLLDGVAEAEEIVVYHAWNVREFCGCR